ncbi:MAG: hypothetical protein P8H56_12285 [Crocinitomicaceae bacterium]|nr:hypothetical protein [Crocinitomicaceae bacterium]
MKRVVLKYLGYKGKLYYFEDSQESTLRFSGVRADLIYEFSLREDRNIKTLFEVTYFVARDDGEESNIISDLKIIPNI